MSGINAVRRTTQRGSLRFISRTAGSGSSHSPQLLPSATTRLSSSSSPSSSFPSSSRQIYSARRFSSPAVATESDDSISHNNSSKSKSKSQPKPKQKKTRKDPIIVTERAADRIKELLNSPNGSGAVGILLGVKRRGCNGLSYTLNYQFESHDDKHHEQMEAHGVKVFIEPMALFSVVGTVMDYEVTDMSSEFTFNNPNSKGECGCGESFNV